MSGTYSSLQSELDSLNLKYGGYKIAKPVVWDLVFDKPPNIVLRHDLEIFLSSRSTTHCPESSSVCGRPNSKSIT
jgi:hypothetical protein